MKRIEQKVIEFIEKQSLIKKKEKLLFAFSGGPDSVFVLYFLNKFKQKYKCNLFAVHFNHQLRGKESDQDEIFAESYCEKLGVPFYSVRLNVKSFSKKYKMSIEEAARKLRYDNLNELCDEFNCDKIVTAHNQSDNTETVLLNVFSGTGVSGFAGIPIKRGRIIRPIICITKQEVLHYLHKNKLEYRIDSSNLDVKFERNFIRNQIIPLLKEKINPSLDAAVFRSSKVLENAVSIIGRKVDTLIKKHVVIHENGISISLLLFQPKYDSLTGEVTKKVLRDLYKHEFIFDDYNKINSLSKKQKGKTARISSGLVAYKEDDHIYIKRFEKAGNKNKYISPGEKISVSNKLIGIEEVTNNNVNYKGGGSVEFIDAANLGDKFLLRKWKNGDRFIPLGMDKYKKVSDYLTDAKIPSAEKKNQLVLISRNNIVWIVGLRIDNRFKITSKTKKIYKLWIK